MKNLSIWGTQLVLEVGDSKEYVFHKQIVVIGSRNKASYVLWLLFWYAYLNQNLRKRFSIGVINEGFTIISQGFARLFDVATTCNIL